MDTERKKPRWMTGAACVLLLVCAAGCHNKEESGEPGHVMTLNDLTVNISHVDRHALLSDWEWLIGSERRPVLVTKAGDAFVQDAGSGAVLFLDTAKGTCTQIAADGRGFEAVLKEKDFVVEHLRINVMAPLLKAGKDVPEGKLWGWVKPPVLGGALDASNLEPTDIAVHFSIMGQIWNRVKDLPPGTSIDQIHFE